MLASNVQEWIDELPMVSEFRVPRWYYSSDPVSKNLHVFVDASSVAYAAVVFNRSVYS
jgi:hypothetical protein